MLLLVVELESKMIVPRFYLCVELHRAVRAMMVSPSYNTMLRLRLHEEQGRGPRSHVNNCRRYRTAK
jgi:hypothetical protein